MATTKNIGFAYPTSPLAKELGYGQSGCYYVAVYDDLLPITRNDVLYACFTLQNVVYMVPSIVPDGLEWGIWSMYKGE